jgi:hypothetical protein
MNEIVRGFDFAGLYVTLQNINENALAAAHGLSCAVVGPDSFAQPRLTIYDDIVYGVLSQNGANGPDAATTALVCQAVQTRLEQQRHADRDQYTRI